MKKTIKKYIELTFEVGKTYKTKWSTGESFTILQIIRSKGKDERILRVEGLFESCPKIGLCPLPVERLIPERIEDGSIDICSNCGEIL